MVKWTRVDVTFRGSHVAHRTPQIHAVATSNYPAESLASNYEKGRRLPHVGIVTNFSRRYYYRPAAFRDNGRQRVRSLIRQFHTAGVFLKNTSAFRLNNSGR